MTEYQKQQEATGRKDERRALAKLRHQLEQDAAGKLDRLALDGAREKLQAALNDERETFLARDKHERAAAEEFRG